MKQVDKPARARILAWVLATALVQLYGCSAAHVKHSSSSAFESRSFALSGRGKAVVVLQSGLGDGQKVWRHLSDQVEDKAVTLVTYDRPGYGTAPATSAPRDPCTIVREQRELLRQHGLKPPYVLVGHSLGGLYQFAYAKLYPEEVSALVLLDPTHPNHWQRMQSDAPVLAGLTKAMRASAFTPTMRREFDAQHECLEQLDLVRPLHIPVRLLIRDRYQPAERGGFERMAHALASDWQRLTGADIERARGSGHYIQRDRPDLVARVVGEVVLSSSSMSN